jgi:hypothetical protein
MGTKYTLLAVAQPRFLKVVDGQGNFIGKFERRAASLENKTRAKSLFVVRPKSSAS